MKKIALIAALAALASVAASAQQKKNYDFDLKFTTDIANPVTPVKNQYRSGTCWAYSGLSLLESEVIRINGIKDTLDYPDFSEGFVFSHSYFDRAVKYVRLDGNLGFSDGSSIGDVLHIVEDYGIVPDADMTGLNYGTDKPVQGELTKVMKSYIETIASNPNKKLTTAWKPGLQGILDAYYGKCPETFKVGKKTYTPSEYRDALKIKPGDYVSITSFTHHPFYSSFVIEVCDNWRWDSSYNVPIDELIEIIDCALAEGYTVGWGTDVSEPGFTRTGYALLIDVDETEKAGSDHDRWVGAETKESEDEPVSYVEQTPTQESRQEGYDNKTITDDHGLQIYGIAHDQFGKKFYIVKNSWGEVGEFGGIWYASEAFVRSQTMNIVLHKDGVPKSISKKLGLK